MCEAKGYVGEAIETWATYDCDQFENIFGFCERLGNYEEVFLDEIIY